MAWIDHFNQTTIQQIERLGLAPENVLDCVIPQLNNEQIGGLADFPKVIVHVGIEELQNFHPENPRYLKHPYCTIQPLKAIT